MNFREAPSDEKKEGEENEEFKAYSGYKIKGTDAGATGGEYIADLEGLVNDGLSQVFKHSFYAYEGSLSQPNCQNRITRVVFSEVITINAEYFENLKGKVLDGFEHINHRKIQNEKVSGNYRIYRHIDTSTRNCSVG